MTLNLEAEINPTKWTKLQAEICMNVANAKYYAFADEALKMAHWVRLGVVQKQVAGDYLHEAAIYNQLAFEYGNDAIQAIMSAAFGSEVAA
jgi:hypothetical protein